MSYERGGTDKTGPDGPAFWALALCTSFVAAGFYSISVVIEPLNDHFAQAAYAHWLLPLIGAIVPLSFAISAPIIARLIENYGVRAVFVASLLLLAVAGSAPAILDNLPLIVLMRALTGIAVSGILNSGISGAGLLPEARRPKVFGLMSMLGGISGILAFPLAGFLASWNWHAVFCINLLALAVVPLALHLPRRAVARTAEAASAASVRMPLALLGLAAFTGLATYAAPMFSPLYLREIGMTNPSLTALPMMVMSVCSMLTAACYSRLQNVLGRHRVFIAAFSLLGLSFAFAGLSPSLPLFTAAMGLFGVSLGILYPNLNATAVFLGREGAARVVGAVTASLYGAQVLFPYIAEPVRSHTGTPSVFILFGLVALPIILWLATGRRFDAPRRDAPALA